jgi:hypothetical protein
MDVPAHYHEAPVQSTPLVSTTLVPSEIPPQVPPISVRTEIPSPIPATPNPNSVSLHRHQQKRNDQNSSATFFTIG